jgi:hypothetical protein
MTLEEARTRLGLRPSGALERTGVKRAYLQAVKRCKPEVDPEGFQRIREAYERLEALLAVGAPGGGRPIVVAADPPPAPDLEEEGDEDDDEDPEREATEPPSDHLRPYRDRVNKLFGQPWPLLAEVGLEAYRAFPGDRAARAFVLGLLPDEAYSDVTNILREGIAAGDRDCLLRLIEYAPRAVPPEPLAALERDGSLYERLLAAGARVARQETPQAMALIDQLLAPEPDGVPRLMLVDSAVRVVLRFQSIGQVAEARAALNRLREYMGGLSLPAGAPNELAALFAVASGLETAEYLPAEVQREVARGALAWSWPSLTSTLAAAARREGQRTLDRKLRRLRLESPALASVIDQHKPVAGTRTSWDVPVVLRYVLPMLLLSLGRAFFGHGCYSETTTPPTPLTAQMAHMADRAVWADELRRDLPDICPPAEQKMLCKLVPTFIDTLSYDNRCSDLESQLWGMAAEATTAPERAYVARLRVAAPRFCRP